MFRPVINSQAANSAKAFSKNIHDQTRTSPVLTFRSNVRMNRHLESVEVRFLREYSCFVRNL